MSEVTIDCMHEICPIPLLKAFKQLDKMEKGDVLIMVINHSCSIKSVMDWVENQGHIGTCQALSENKWKICIEKSK